MANIEINMEIDVSRKDALKAAKVLELYLLDNEDLKLVFERVDELPVVSLIERKKEVNADGFGGFSVKYLE